MKTLKSLFITLSLLALTNTLSANAGGDITTKELSDKVKQSITTPESIKEKHRSEKITVFFTVNESGKVIEANATSKDKKAKEDLEKQFLNLNFQGLKPCVVNSVDISFLVL